MRKTIKNQKIMKKVKFGEKSEKRKNTKTNRHGNVKNLENAEIQRQSTLRTVRKS